MLGGSRKRAEAEAAADALFRHAPIACALVDARLRVRRATPVFCELLTAKPGTVPVRIPAAERATLRAAIEERRDARIVLAPAGLSGTGPIALVLSPAGPGRALLWVDPQTAEAEREAATRLRAIGRIAGGVAHDFNNLLLAIIASADALAAGAGDAVPEDLAQIRASAERGALLVRQLLAAGQQQVLKPEPVDVNEAVETMAGVVRRLLGPGISVRRDLCRPARFVRVDRSQLDQVLLNLFVNARAAMNGAGVLTVATRSAVLLDPTPDGPETVPPGRYTVIEVADTGAGIAPDFLPRIFEPFVSGTGGTGLGLATVHGIVRQSGGYIGVASALGQGTSFRIYLPREDEQPAPARTMPEPATGAGQTDTVLLVEDEAPVRRLAQRALEATGFVVIAVDSGEEALARLDRGDHPGIIVTDLSMPGMSGSALLDAARARVPGLPAVVMSGYADPDVRAGLDAAGPVRFLAKPFGMDALIEAVRKEIRAVAPA